MNFQTNSTYNKRRAHTTFNKSPTSIPLLGENLEDELDDEMSEILSQNDVPDRQPKSQINPVINHESYILVKKT